MSSQPVSKQQKLTLYTLAQTLNNFPSAEVVTGSVIDARICSSNHFGLFVKFESGSATNFANTPAIFHVDWSPNGTDWHGDNVAESGSIATIGSWFYHALTGSWPFCRILMKNTSGSAVSGSIIFIGI